MSRDIYIFRNVVRYVVGDYDCVELVIFFCYVIFVIFSFLSRCMGNGVVWFVWFWGFDR